MKEMKEVLMLSIGLEELKEVIQEVVDNAVGKALKSKTEDEVKQQFLTAREVGKTLGVSRATVTRMTQDGRLTPRFTGSIMRFSREEVESLIR